MEGMGQKIMGRYRTRWERGRRGEHSRYQHAPPAHWDGPLSLQFLGRQKLLAFAAVLGFERTRPGAKTVTLFDGSYRFADGAFLYNAINGTDRLTFIYESKAQSYGSASCDRIQATGIRVAVGRPLSRVAGA
jgi:hypothetical protein